MEMKCSDVKDYVIVPLEVLKEWQKCGNREDFLLSINHYIHEGERF